jgi:hypothetical protein
MGRILVNLSRATLIKSILALIKDRESGAGPDSFGRYAATPSLRSVAMDQALTRWIHGRALHGARQR